MAQAARLSLRLQKELKLLLSDPPPGASFPRLSSAAAGSGDLSVLSTIDAQIEGPEGTVYANGIFNLKIQIPDRYPFQPPIVTFSTPIYHPNIDSGGRICLDILNLPPKGAWQPSLNISTVLTSIGLLLSEPNPDDGLMCDASREYKYNKQAFDQKARAMTEQYAKVEMAGSSVCSQIQNSPNTGSVKIHGDGNASETKDNNPADDHPKQGEFSVGSSSINHTQNFHMTAYDAQDHQAFLSDSGHQAHSNGKRKAAIGACDLGNNRVQTSRRKLSLASSAQVQKKDNSGNELSTHDMNSGSNLSPGTQKEPVSSSGMSLPMHQRRSNTYGDSATRVEHNPVVKKLSLGLKCLSVKRGREVSENGNTASKAQTFGAKSDDIISQKLCLRPLGLLQMNNAGNDRLLGRNVSISSEETGSNRKQYCKSLCGDLSDRVLEETSMVAEAIVVLDSDDSAEEEEEEETGSSRCRLSLTRRRNGKQRLRA